MMLLMYRIVYVFGFDNRLRFDDATCLTLKPLSSTGFQGSQCLLRYFKSCLKNCLKNCLKSYFKSYFKNARSVSLAWSIATTPSKWPRLPSRVSSVTSVPSASISSAVRRTPSGRRRGRFRYRASALGRRWRPVLLLTSHRGQS